MERPVKRKLGNGRATSKYTYIDTTYTCTRTHLVMIDHDNMPKINQSDQIYLGSLAGAITDTLPIRLLVNQLGNTNSRVIGEVKKHGARPVFG